MQSFREIKFGHGKRLPDALYLWRPQKGDVPDVVLEVITRAETAAKPAADWNLAKLHLNQFAISFLSYPGFDVDPHPALREATKINMRSGSIERVDYSGRGNPPILHRKETFLPKEDPRFALFAALTNAEEAAGLYADSSKIGLRHQWQTLLRRLGWRHDNHVLIRVQPDGIEQNEPREVARHRTAIRRYDLSKPTKQLLERNLLKKNESFFDYGCGHGMDIQALQHLGYQAAGWDPAFLPNAPKVPSDVVNLGYVLNVIEDAKEREEALHSAFALTKKVLLVSTLVAGKESDSHSTRYRDGYITKTNTFQKFFLPGELEGLLERTLGAEAITLAYGLCAVFKDPDAAELFQAAQNRRRLDWTTISLQLKFTTPTSRERSTVSSYELHKELFEDFWKCLVDLGRAPEPGEYDRLEEINAAGGVRKAMLLTVEHHGAALWEECRKARSEDVLAYLAMTKFRRRFLRREIPPRIRHDIRSFFGDIQTAQRKAEELLFAAGDSDEIEIAAASCKVGWQDEEALIVHRALFASLPPLLRIYVLCASHRYGDPAQADLIKIHKHSGKVTFQHYDDFDNKPLPVLMTRIKINLRNLFVEVIDHSKGTRVQVLYFKERFVAPDHPHRAKMEVVSKKLRKLGLDEKTIGYGPDMTTLAAMLASAGLTENLTPIRPRREAKQS